MKGGQRGLFGWKELLRSAKKEWTLLWAPRDKDRDTPGPGAGGLRLGYLEYRDFIPGAGVASGGA